MAKLYFCNNGDIELRPETLAVLRGMPKSWNVFLNARPANPQGKDREVDALVITEHALHLIEFKYRKDPIVIESEGHWRAGGVRMENSMRRESPQEQVLATHDALQEWLRSRRFPAFASSPWVVLENPNAKNIYGGKPFRINWYQPAGKVWLLNGVDRLEAVIRGRDGKGARSQPKPTQTDVDRIREVLGAQPLHTMVIQGSVLSLDSGEPVVSLPFKVTPQDPRMPTAEGVTGPDGSFEALGLPVGPFKIELEIKAEDGWRTVPTVDYPGRPGFVPVRIFVARPELGEDEIKRLLEPELQRFEVDLKLQVEAVQADLESELAALREKLDSHEELLLEFMDRPHTSELVQEALQKEIAFLRTREFELSAWAETDLDHHIESSLDPLRNELHALKERIEKAERVAAEAAAAASEAARRAEATRVYQEARAKLEEQRYEDEQAEALFKRQQRDRMAEALKWSAIVGGAGGIISMQPIPFADNVILTPMQIGLVMYIGKIYGHEFTRDLAFKLVGPVGMGFLAQHGTILLYKLIPGAWGLGAITVPAFTLALGWAAARYFEQGTAPSRAERNRALRRSIAILRDPQIRAQMKELGASLVAELKQRKFRVTPEDIKLILERLGEQGSGIGERLRDLMTQDEEKVAPSART